MRRTTLCRRRCAPLHERFAEWLAEHAKELIELDEVLGYHLEQSARYHEQLGSVREDLAVLPREVVDATDW